MVLHLKPLPGDRAKLILAKGIRHSLMFLQHIRAARAAGIKERAEREQVRQKLAERRRIGAEALAVNIRAVTGNHGKPKPR